jgi:hypothetical protein
MRSEFGRTAVLRSVQVLQKLIGFHPDAANHNPERNIDFDHHRHRSPLTFIAF